MGLDLLIGRCIHQLEEAALFWSYDSLLTRDSEATEKVMTTVAQKRCPSPADAARVRHLLTDVQYALLSVNFGCEPREDFHDLFSEFCRMSLILLSMTILNERSPPTSLDLKIGDIFRQTLSELLQKSQTVAYQPLTIVQAPYVPVDFLLWTVFLAASVMATTESESDTLTWLLSTAVRLRLSNAEIGAIDDFSDFKSALCRYLWIPTIHDPRSLWLWSQIQDLRNG